MDDSPEDTANEAGRDEEDSQSSRGGTCRPSKRLTLDASDASEPNDRSRQPSHALEERSSPPETQTWSETEAAGEVVDLLEPPASSATTLRWEGPGRLVYQPALHQVGVDRYAVKGKREGPRSVPWGFWGGLLFVGVAIFALFGAQSIYTLWEVFWVVLGLSIGALMFRYGPKSQLEEATLCEIDGRRGELHWPDGAQSGLDEMRVGFEAVTEVVFGMTRLPVSDSGDDAHVDAFALLVRTERDELIPVVEGSPYKGSVHEIAQFLADATQTELTYVGRGIK